jgi:hypothetical protein
MPVPITSTSSRGFLVFKLGSSFLKKQIMQENWNINRHEVCRKAMWLTLNSRFSAVTFTVHKDDKYQFLILL